MLCALRVLRVLCAPLVILVTVLCSDTGAGVCVRVRAATRVGVQYSECTTVYMRSSMFECA